MGCTLQICQWFRSNRESRTYSLFSSLLRAGAALQFFFSNIRRIEESRTYSGSLALVPRDGELVAGIMCCWL